MRHLWGTMRVRGEPCGCPYFLGLAMDSRIVMTGLKVWCCVGASGPDSRSSAPDAGPHAGRRLRVGGKTGPVSIKQAPRP